MDVVPCELYFIVKMIFETRDRHANKCETFLFFGFPEKYAQIVSALANSYTISAVPSVVSLQYNGILVITSENGIFCFFFFTNVLIINIIIRSF